MTQPETGFKPNVLVAPLDWGLGHATRCIPVISELLRQNAHIVLAGEGNIKNLLQKEFPQLSFARLKGYNIRYSQNKWTLPFVLATQIPKIISAIKYENIRLREIVNEHKIDGIISDNRYGLFHANLPSVFITHQLLIKTSLGNFADEYLQNLNYNYINKFTECWVPDTEHLPGLANELSHPKKLPAIPVKYIGALSRFKMAKEEKSKHLLILLSGPEPQRTILENIFIEQLKFYKEAVVFVRGLLQSSEEIKLLANVTVFNHLPAEALNKKMNEANFVISRSGYSTVMDLAAVKKKSILIATPGQSEQEYLAKHLMKNNFSLSVDQNKFKLKAVLELAQNFNYKTDHFQNETHLESAVKSFLYKIQFNVK